MIMADAHEKYAVTIMLVLLQVRVVLFTVVYMPAHNRSLL